MSVALCSLRAGCYLLDHAPHIPTAHAGGQVGGPGRSRPTIFLFRSKFDVQCSTFDVRIQSSDVRRSHSFFRCEVFVFNLSKGERPTSNRRRRSDEEKMKCELRTFNVSVLNFTPQCVRSWRPGFDMAQATASASVRAAAARAAAKRAGVNSAACSTVALCGRRLMTSVRYISGSRPWLLQLAIRV